MATFFDFGHPVNNDSITLQPNSPLEALYWAFSCNAYSVKDALRLSPLVLRKDSEPRCLRFNQGRATVFSLEFRFKGIQNHLTWNSHGSLPEALRSIPIEDSKENYLKRYFLKSQVQYLKNIFRLSPIATYILFVILFSLAIHWSREWIVTQVEARHWMTWGSCSLNCAKAMTYMHLLAFFIGTCILSIIFWGPAFYLLNKKAPKTYQHLLSMKIEGGILLIAGVTLSWNAINTGILSKYQEIALQHWSGSLTLRAPASNAPPSANVRGNDGESG